MRFSTLKEKQLNKSNLYTFWSVHASGVSTFICMSLILLDCLILT